MQGKAENNWPTNAYHIMLKLASGMQRRLGAAWQLIKTDNSCFSVLWASREDVNRNELQWFNDLF